MIDYAHPTMMAEKALKDLHNAMLMRQYDEAIEKGMEAIAEVRLAIHAIRHDAEKKGVDNR
jgi:hypothetical protein